MKGTMDQNQNEQSSGQQKLPFYKKRGFKYGSLATAFTAIFVAIVVLLNVGLSVLSARYPISVDLTASHDYGISAATIKYVQTVKTPITIKIFATQDTMQNTGYMSGTLAGATRVIEQYHKYNDKINVQFIDYEKNPTAAAAYPNESIQQGDVVVSATVNGKERYKHLSMQSDIILSSTDSSTYQTTYQGNQAEQQIDNAINYVTSENLPTVQIVSGHNESSSDFASLLTSNNFKTATVNTTTGKLDANAAAVAIVYPTVDFTSAEITKLDAFLKNGGNYGKTAFIFFDPQQIKLPNLEEYCSEWGIKVGTGLLYDQTNSLDNQVADIACTNVDTSVTGSIQSSIATDVAIARPLTLLFSSKDVRTAKAVITTPETTQLHPSVTGSASSSDPKAAYVVMALATWSQGSSTTTVQKSNLLVSGSSSIAASGLVSQSNKNNGRVLAGIANTLMNKAASVTVNSKYTTSSTLTLTAAARVAVIVIFLVLVPLLLLVLGVAQFLRRRHL